MSANIAKKEAIRKFKEQKPSRGVYAIRCTATGRVWVGSSRNLDATRNGAWFMLRTGSHIEKSLQQEWNSHGESAFQYEILETLEPDLHPMAVADLLKEKSGRWVEQLSAKPLLPG
jgi:hypothetical protein